MTLRHCISLGAAVRGFGFVLGLGASLLAPVAAHAQSLIRDAEIEHTIRSYADPIFAAAGLNAKDVSIYLVNDPSINAFVAGGQNMFMNTGTIMQLERPRALIAIIAHETGHIAGGHLARASDAYAKATVPLIIGTLLGIAAAASGAPDAGIGIMTGGQNIAQRSVLAYTRTQESAADQAAINFLNATRQSAKGLLDTFEIFATSEILSERHIDPYVVSHPLSRERIAAVENRIAESPFKDIEETPAQKQGFVRMQAKLHGFLDRQDQVLRRYPLTDKSIAARYARAIAYYRIPDLPKAFAELDPIIAAEPGNPYFHELKGQILFENGRAAEAVPEHAESVRLMPKEPLFKVNLGQAMVATEDPQFRKRAVEVLEEALRQDPDNTFAWHQISIAYAQDGQIPMAELATAEKLDRAGRPMEAISHAQRALCGIPKGTPAARRAQDIVATSMAQIDPEGRRRKELNGREEADDTGQKRGPRCENFGSLDGGGAARRG